MPPTKYMSSTIALVTQQTRIGGKLMKYDLVSREDRLLAAGARAVLHFPSDSFPLSVSPDLRWVLCTRRNKDYDTVSLFVSDADTGRARSIGTLSTEMKVAGWSRDGRYVLFQNPSSAKRELTVCHPGSATMVPIRLPGNPNILYCFWQNKPALMGTSLLIASEERDSRYRPIPRHHILRFTGTAFPTKTSHLADGSNTSSVLDSAVGITATLVIGKWVEARNTFAYLQGEAPIVIARHGARAFIVVDEFHKSSPEWAAPDRARVLVGVNRKVYERNIQPVPDAKSLQWTSDGHHLLFIGENIAVRVDPFTGGMTTQRLPQGIGKVIQFWSA